MTAAAVMSLPKIWRFIKGSIRSRSLPGPITREGVAGRSKEKFKPFGRIGPPAARNERFAQRASPLDERVRDDAQREVGFGRACSRYNRPPFLRRFSGRGTHPPLTRHDDDGIV